MTKDILEKASILASKIYKVNEILKLDDPIEIIARLQGMAEFNVTIEPFLSSIKTKVIELKNNLQEQFEVL